MPPVPPPSVAAPTGVAASRGAGPVGCYGRQDYSRNKLGDLDYHHQSVAAVFTVWTWLDDGGTTFAGLADAEAVPRIPRPIARARAATMRRRREFNTSNPFCVEVWTIMALAADPLADRHLTLCLGFRAGTGIFKLSKWQQVAWHQLR
jgi:hypothetical protein